MQDFDLEIKDKKGSDNVIANHLSRMEKPIEEERWTETEENFPDEQFFQVSVQLPWYVDIVNYLAYGIMPPGFSYQHKRKLRTDARLYIYIYGMTHYCLEERHMKSLEDVCQKMSKVE